MFDLFNFPKRRRVNELSLTIIPRGDFRYFEGSSVGCLLRKKKEKILDLN
jgi:hypothetical protein